MAQFSTDTLSGGEVDLLDGMTAVTVGIRARLLYSLALPSIVVIVLIVCVGATQNSSFYSGPTWSNIGITSSYLVITACGEGLVMVAGGIDLSVGAEFLAGAMTAAAVNNAGVDVATSIIIGILAGFAIGLLNGLLVSYMAISPIIVTLGTLFAITSLITTTSRGYPIGPLSNSFDSVGSSTLFYIPSLVFYAIGIALLAHVLLEYTTIGTRLRSIGGNRDAAISLGLPVRPLTIGVYVLSGCLAAFAGVLQASNLGAADSSYGSNLELDAIAAVIVGGVSVYGAVGSVMGMVAGGLLLSLLTIALVLFHFAGSMQEFVVGLVMIGAVSVDQLRRRRMFSISLRGRPTREGVSTSRTSDLRDTVAGGAAAVRSSTGLRADK